MKKAVQQGSLGLTLMLMSVFAMASPYASLETAVDFSAVSTTLLAVAATVIGVLITIKAIQWIKSGVKRG